MSHIASEINNVFEKFDSTFVASRIFADMSEKAKEENKTEDSEIFDILSMIYRSNIDNKQDRCPYVLQYKTNREKFNIERLPEQFLELISTIVEFVNNPLARGRLTDILWINKYSISDKVKPYEWAKKTIENYTPSSILSDTTWLIFGRQELERAIILSIKIRSKAQLNKIAFILKEEILNSTIDNRALPLHLLYFFNKHNLPVENLNSIIEKIENLAEEFGATGDFYFQQQFLAEIAEYYRSKDENKFIEYKNLEGLLFYNFGNEILVSENPNYLQASFCFERAYQVFREIPYRFRDPLKIQYLMNCSQRLQRECIIISRKQVKTVTKSIEVSDYIINAQNFIKKLDFKHDLLSSILKLFALTDPGTYDDRHQKAVNNIKNYLFLHISQTRLYTQDGRLSRTISPYDDEDIESSDTHIQYLIFMDYNIFISFETHIKIIPFLDIIRSRNLITETDIEKIVNLSPFIPSYKIKMWTKGLWAGIQGDFIVSLFILSPLVEDLIRVILKYHWDVDTMFTEPNGQQIEKGLSTLIKDPKIEDAIDKDLVYELDTLFCNNIGFNLRNNVAHGLVDDDLLESYISAYSWWFIFKLIVLSINCKQREGNDLISS